MGQPERARWILAAAGFAAALGPACARTPPAHSHSASRDLVIGVALPRGTPSIGLNALASSLRIETLITLGADGRPEPRLATAWTRSADGLTWTFRLAPNIYFQDGQRATARSLAPLLQAAVADPENQSQRPNLAEITTVTAQDENTIVIRTRVPRVLLPDQLSDLPIRGQSSGSSLGPFVRENDQGETISFRAFEKYYRGRPGVDRVAYKSYRSVRAAWAAMMRGETDAIYEVGRDAGEFVQAESGVREYPFVRPFTAALVFNVSRPVLRPAEVRRALSSMIDRVEIVTGAYRGHAIVANGPLWPFHWALAERGRLPAAPSGLTAASSPADRIPAGLRFTCLVVPTLSPFERTALIIQKQLYDHGVDMRLESVTIEEMADRLVKKDFDAVLFESLSRTPNWIYTFWHSPRAGMRSAMNSGYRAADESLDRLLASENDDQVRRAVADVYRVMEADPPAVFIAWPEVSRAMIRDFDTAVGAGRDVLAASSIWMVRPAGATP